MAKSVYKDMHNSEKKIAAYLKELKIRWQYEQPVYVHDDKNRPRVWTPDFYLPELGIYIEVCGTDKFNYEYREKIYKENKLPVIFIHQYKDKEKWKRFLKKRISEIHEGRGKIIKNL